MTKAWISSVTSAPTMCAPRSSPVFASKIVFTMPSGPIKCAGAPQKIVYLAADYWRKQGVLDDIDVHLVVPTPRLFGIAPIADSLDAVAADPGAPQADGWRADLRRLLPLGVATSRIVTVDDRSERAHV